MLAKVYSAFPYGLGAMITEVEVEVEPGLRAFHIIGLPDEAVREATRRVGSALRHAGFQSPYQMNKKVVVNLAPADIKKQGSFFDTAIAIGFLAASNQIPLPPKTTLFIGELGLEGLLRPIPGVLGIAMTAKKKGFSHIAAPYNNAYELSLIPDITPLASASLGELVLLLAGKLCSPALKEVIYFAPSEGEYNLSDIRGQESAKRALEIAAAGGHHFFMVGPPGAGKSILAKTLPSLLPALSRDEGVEVANVQSALEPLAREGSGKISLKRPFRSPHHSASAQAVLGGGSPVMPGEITLAHRGILLLDEFPEFHRDVLEGLRQPLEERVIRIARSNHRFLFPAHFQLVGTANPCPCGFKDDQKEVCTCTQAAINRYQRKLSGPLMDRVDIFVSVPRLSRQEILSDGAIGGNTKTMRIRVEKAREIQKRRLGNFKTNVDMTVPEIKRFCSIDGKGEALVARAIEHFNLSMRSYHKLLKTARTIADLNSSEEIKEKYILESLQYRKPL